MVGVDGTDYEISKVAHNTLQALTYSAKSKKNCLRFLIYGVTNGRIITSMPFSGMFCSGYHNDAKSFDNFQCFNKEGMNDLLPLKKVVWFLDRGFARSEIVKNETTFTYLPCTKSVAPDVVPATAVPIITPNIEQMNQNNEEIEYAPIISDIETQEQEEEEKQTTQPKQRRTSKQYVFV